METSLGIANSLALACQLRGLAALVSRLQFARGDTGQISPRRARRDTKNGNGFADQLQRHDAQDRYQALRYLTPSCSSCPSW